MSTQNSQQFASKEDVQEVVDLASRHASDTTILFVSSIRDEEPRPMGNDGLSQLAQYYTEAQVDDIVSAFRSIPVTVLTFFSEKELISYFANEFDREKISRFPMVYTTAEGGVGSGRRALIPTVSNLYGIPCCNSGAYGSSVGRHKFHSNRLARSNGASVPDSWYFMRNAKWFGDQAPPCGTKVILKPTYESASIGISDDSVVQVASDFDDLCSRLLERWGQPVSVQEFRSGYEIGVPVVQLDEVRTLPFVGFSGPSHERYGGEFRTFEQENLQPSRDYYLPEFLTDEQTASMSSEAIRAFNAAEMEGAGRVDMRIDEDGKWYAFDINESPPPVLNSGMGFAIQSLGYDYREFLMFLVGLNLKLRYPDQAI